MSKNSKNVYQDPEPPCTLGEAVAKGFVPTSGKVAKKSPDGDFGIPDLTGIRSAEDMTSEVEMAGKRDVKITAYLEAVPQTVRTILGRIRAKAGVQEALQILQERILDIPDPELRTSARWLYAREFASDAVENGGSPNMFEALKRLGMKEGLGLVREPGDKEVVRIRVQVGKKFYIPTEVPAGMEKVVVDTFKALHQLSGITKEKQYEDRKTALGAFTENVSREWEDLLAGKPGAYVIRVPDEEGTKLDRETGEKKPWTYYGGHIKVGSDGKVIMATGALGNASFERSLGDAMTWQVEITVSSIKEERAGLNGRLPEPEFKAACHVHRLMRRALALHEANMAKKAEADKAKAKATVEHADFLLKAVDGVAFIKHARFNEVAHAWALVERKDGKIRVVEANPSEGLFQSGSFEFAVEGEEFAGLDKTLRNFLRYAKNKAGQAKEKEQGSAFDEKEEVARAAEARQAEDEGYAKWAASQEAPQAAS